MKKIVQKLIFISLLSLLSVPTFAAFDGSLDNDTYTEEESGDFLIIEKDENGIPLSGYYKGGHAYSRSMTEDVHDYLIESKGQAYADKVKSSGRLVYIRNGYGGPYISGGNVSHPTSWSFNILLPYTAMNTPMEIENYAYKYIPLNNKYDAGGQSQSAYGYASGVNSLGFSNITKNGYDNKYTLKYVSSDPATGIFYSDNTGHLEMTSKNKVVDGKTKPFWGEYRFNGVSGNGESLNNAFFPDDITSPRKNADGDKHNPVWFKRHVGSLVPFEKKSDYITKTGSATYENKNKKIREDALIKFLNKFYGSDWQSVHNLDDWNKYIRIDNSPLASSATFTCWYGSYYQSFTLPKSCESDLVLKSIVVFDTDKDGNIIKCSDGSYQTIGEFTRKDNLDSQLGDFRVDKYLNLNKPYKVAVNVMNKGSKTKTIAIEGLSNGDVKIANKVYPQIFPMYFDRVEETLKMPKQIGETTKAFGSWIKYQEAKELFNWNSLTTSNDLNKTYKLLSVPTIQSPSYKLSDENLDSINLQETTTAFNAGASIAFGFDKDNAKGESGILKLTNKMSALNVKGKDANAILIRCVLPVVPEVDSNINNNTGWLVLPLASDDMGMKKMVVKDPDGKVIPDGGILDKDIEYTIDYEVKKVSGNKKVQPTKIYTLAKDKEKGTELIKRVPGINEEDVLELEKDVPIINNKIKFDEKIDTVDVIRVCGIIDDSHAKKGENIKNDNDVICQEFKKSSDDMSIPELILKDANGRIVSEVSPNAQYRATFVVRKDFGNKVVKDTTLNTTINGGQNMNITTNVPLEEGKIVTLDRNINTPGDVKEIKICGVIDYKHDGRKENIRDEGDTICRTFGQNLNFYVNNFRVNPSVGVIPEGQSTMAGTPVTFSFDAGLNVSGGEAQSTNIVIKQPNGQVIWSQNISLRAGEVRQVTGTLVLTKLPLGNHVYTVEINPNKKPKEITPDNNPYKDNKATTTFSVIKNPECFQCYEKNTRIDWSIYYKTVETPGYEKCGWVYNGSHDKDYECWCVYKSPRTILDKTVNFWETYKFTGVYFRSKYTKDNAARMRAKGATVDNQGWLDVMNLSNKTFAGIKSGYGFELKVITEWDSNHDCTRSIPSATSECIKTIPECYLYNFTVEEKSYNGKSTNVDVGPLPPTFVTPNGQNAKVCLTLPLKDNQGNPLKMEMSLQKNNNKWPSGPIERTFQVPLRSVVKKGVSENKIYINRDVQPSFDKGYNLKLTTNRKMGMYQPKSGKQGWLQDCFNFDIYVVGKMEEDVVTHIMD